MVSDERSAELGLSMTVIDRLQDLEKVKRTLDDYFHIKVETRDTSLKGYNWGKALVQGEFARSGSVRVR